MGLNRDFVIRLERIGLGGPGAVFRYKLRYRRQEQTHQVVVLPGIKVRRGKPGGNGHMFTIPFLQHVPHHTYQAVVRLDRHQRYGDFIWMRCIAIGKTRTIITVGRRIFVGFQIFQPGKKCLLFLRAEAAIAGIQGGPLKIQQLPVFVGPCLVVGLHRVFARFNLIGIGEIPFGVVLINFFG